VYAVVATSVHDIHIEKADAKKPTARRGGGKAKEKKKPRIEVLSFSSMFL